MYQPLFARSLTEDERGELASVSNLGAGEEFRRATVVLMSASGCAPSEIAEKLGYHPSNVKKWIKKFNEEGIPGLTVRKRGPREGPKPRFTRDQVARLLRLWETEPATLGLGFDRWTAQKLATVAVERGIVRSISHVTVRQILKRNEAKRNQPVTHVEAEDLVAAGGSALKNSEFEEAANVLYRALAEGRRTEEQEADIRVMLSQALEELSRFEEVSAAVSKYEDPHALIALSPVMRARVKLRVGWAYSWLRDHPKAIAHLNDAKRAFLELQDDRGVSEAQYALGRTYFHISEFRIARDHFMAALALVSPDRDPELVARIYLQLGTIDFHEGAHARSKETYIKAYRLVEGSRRKNLIGQILLNRGGLFEEEDPRERERSAEYSRQAITCLEEGGQRNFLALAYNNLGDRLLRSGLWEEAIDNFNRAVEIARQYEQRSDEATARVSLGEILCAKGRYVQAEDQIRASLALVGGGSDKWLEAYALQILSSIQRDTGRYEGALNALRQSLRISTAIGDMNLVTSAQIALAECHFLQGGYEQAKEYLELTEGRLREEREKSLHVSGWLQRLTGLLEGALGRLAAARQHVAQSISIFTTTEVPYELAKSHLAMAQILATTGEEDVAIRHVESALETFERLGAEPEIKLSREAIAALRAGTAITLPGFRVPLDYRLPVQLAGEEPASVREAAPDTEPVKPEPEAVSTSTSNDVLLMERLIEASQSRELLLQELAAVINENFPTEFVVVGKVEEGERAQAVICKGISTADAEGLCDELGPSLLEPSKHRGPGFLSVLTVSRESLERDGAAALFVHAAPRPGALLDVARLNPLIKQAELGLEACSLRVAVTSAPEARSEQRIHTVMPGFIVASPLMLDVIKKIQKIRTSDVTVLITGESGTGKELVARAVHAESARARAIFLPFNCTATPRDLIESQLFGHRRGAFTGATANYVGMIRAAEGGTLFLDEIGDLALEIQPKLMRFLQEGEIQPLGETRPTRVDVRVIAATNSDLERAVEEGRFREDLFHRLNIIRIHVPTLRERRDEIPALASHFLEHFAARSGKRGVALTQDAVESLSAYDWPGNVRQLRNEIERVMAYSSDGSKISSEDLSPEVVNPSRGLRSRSNQAASEFQVRRPDRGPEDGSRKPPLFSHAGENGNGRARVKMVTFKEAIAELETKLISEALLRNNNNLSRTAIELGLSRRGLRLKLAQLGIERSLAQ